MLFSCKLLLDKSICRAEVPANQRESVVNGYENWLEDLQRGDKSDKDKRYLASKPGRI